MATMNSGLGGTAGFGENSFKTNGVDTGNLDDGAVFVDASSVFGSGLDVFGSNYTGFYINSNGSVTFGAAEPSFTETLLTATHPKIAPFLTDVNINSGGDIHWDLDPSSGKITITWDGVAPYSGSGANSFQLVLTDTGGGDFDIEVIYGDIQYTDGGQGDATAGIADGNGAISEFEGSGDGAVLSGYETNDFDGGDPDGTLTISVQNGMPDGFGGVDGTSGNDTMGLGYTDAEGDEITTGDNHISGNAGDDSISAASGDDTVDGGDGDDTIDGGTEGPVAVSWTDVSDGASLQGTTGQDFFRWTPGEETSATIRFNNSAAPDDGDGVADYVLITNTVNQDSEDGLLTIGDFDMGTDKIVLQENYQSINTSFGSGFTDVMIRYPNGNRQFFKIYHQGAFDSAQVFTTTEPSSTLLSDDDVLLGGADADTFVVQDAFGSDTIEGGETTTTGQDLDTLDLSALTGAATVSFTGLGAGTATDGSDTLSFSEIERIVGTGQGDTLDASADTGGVEVEGGDGSDSITGGSGGDSIASGAGADTVLGGGGDDTIQYGAGDDLVLGGAGNDDIDDSASFTTGNNTIHGGDGDDTIRGSGGSDTIFGDAGDDNIEADGGADSVDGGSGNDSIWTFDQNDTVFGGAGDDVIDGGAGDDSIAGDQGSGGIDAPIGKFTYEYYELDGGGLPSSLADAGFIDGATNINSPTGRGTVDVIDEDPIDAHHGGNDDTYALKLTTTLTVTTGGTYTFDLRSDDGSKLFVDGVELIDNDGNHAATTVSGNLSLSPGSYVIEIIYFERDGNEILRTDLTGPDTGGTPVALESANVGLSYDDTLIGGTGSDTITGGLGADSISGGADADSLAGGDDADIFVIEDGFGSDTIAGGEGTSTGADDDVIDLSALTVPVTVTFTAEEAGTITDGMDTLSFSEIERIVGTDQADSVDGFTASPVGGIHIDGGGGDDTIIGSNNGTGDDTLIGGAGNDSIRGWHGDDSLVGGTGDDQLQGDIGADTLEGGAGNDTLDSWFGAASLSGGDDADLFYVFDAATTVDTGAGFDGATIVGGEGGTDDDTIDLSNFGSGVTVTYSGNEAGTITDGTDTLIFSEIERIILTDQADVVDASADGAGVEIVAAGGDDTVTGGSGADTVNGGAGADSIFGGGGNDSITGGAGDDVIVLTPGGGADTVSDFDIADTDLDGFFNDQLDVSALTGGSGSGGAVRSSDVAVSDDGFGNALLTFPGGETVVLQGVAPASISAQSQLVSAGIPCFAAGTLIRTESGEVPVECLRPGDRVATRDNGPRELLWVAMRRLSRDELCHCPSLRPIQIRAGPLGNETPLVVSPQHGLLLRLDGNETLVRAKHLAALPGGTARVMRGCRRVTYCHLLFENHEVVFSNGIPSESFFPGPEALRGLGPRDVAALAHIMPDLIPIRELERTQACYGRPVRAYSRRRMLPSHGRAFTQAL